MAVSCPEVMYGAYYPYLYPRGAARSFHHAPHFQYDRFNVQGGSGTNNGGGAGGIGAGSVDGFGGAALSSGSASSGASPPPHHAALHHAAAAARLRAKEEDLSAHSRASADGGGSSESEGECGGAGASGIAGRARAQYVSANCVVFTHYSGDAAAVVDDHFQRALSVDKPKESVPMVSRNLPASFFNAAALPATGVPPPCAGVDLYDYDPWHQHYSGYGAAAAAHASAHRHAAEYHAAHGLSAAHAHAHAAHGLSAAAGYAPLLLPRSSLHAPPYKPDVWHQQHAHLDSHAPYSYPSVPGLEAQVQDTSKDLYWF